MRFCIHVCTQPNLHKIAWNLSKQTPSYPSSPKRAKGLTWMFIILPRKGFSRSIGIIATCICISWATSRWCDLASFSTAEGSIGSNQQPDCFRIGWTIEISWNSYWFCFWFRGSVLGLLSLLLVSFLRASGGARDRAHLHQQPGAASRKQLRKSDAFVQCCECMHMAYGIACLH